MQPRSICPKVLMRWISNAFLISGVLSIAVFCSLWAQSYLFQRRAERLIDRQIAAFRSKASGGSESTLSESFSTTGQAIKDDSLIGELEIPRLGVSVAVLQGVGDRTLRVAAGHVPETALPGQLGNVAIAAHRDTFFRALRNIRDGDEITLQTATGEYEYQVNASWVVKPQQVEVLAPTPYRSLTLITCYPFYLVGSAPDRFVVRAHQIGSGAAATAISKVIPGHRPEGAVDYLHSVIALYFSEV